MEEYNNKNTYTNTGHDDAFYSNRKALPFEYYGKSYNNTRRSRAVIIGCCMRSYKPFRMLDEKTQETYIRRAERSCYNSSCIKADSINTPCNWENPVFVNIYNIISYRVQKNLEVSYTDDSRYLMDSIINGTFDITSIGNASSNELRPSVSSKILEDIEMRKEQKVIKKYSTQHECYKCGGRKTTEVEIQTRALDEGSTLVITCELEECGNTWKVSS